MTGQTVWQVPPGVTAISLWRYALATTLGMLSMTFVFAGLGNSFELSPLAASEY